MSMPMVEAPGLVKRRDVIEVHARDRRDLAFLADALTPLGASDPRVDAATRRVTVPVDGGASVLPAVVRALDYLQVEIDDLSLRRPTLDEVFVTRTGPPPDRTPTKSS